ncbi:MAG: FlgD immunoglobulin-like domain containing protein [Candidatus Hatepunaea meridiana]|nr:FlgD immunoglobulin-like domain containing protein [Candidatus Hatepunaea meridiana]
MKKVFQKIIVILLILTISSGFIYAQPNILWSNEYGGNNSERQIDILQTDNVTYLILANTSSYGAGSSDIWVLNIDRNGDTLWTCTYGGEESDRANKIIPVQDGWVIFGHSESFGEGDADFYVVAIDAIGEELWSNTYGTEQVEILHDAILTEDGGYLLAGNNLDENNEPDDFYVIKIDAEGNEDWSEYYGGNNSEHLIQIELMEDGCFILAGNIHSEDENWDILTIGINADGEELWSEIHGNELDDYFQKLISTSDGNFVVLGSMQPVDRNGEPEGGRDVQLLKIEPEEGWPLWSNQFGYEDHDFCYDFIETTDGGFAMVGSSIHRRMNDHYIIKTNEDGDQEWNSLLDEGGTFDILHNIIQTPDGGYVISGGSGFTRPRIPQPFGCLYILHVNDRGEPLWDIKEGGAPYAELMTSKIIRTKDDGYIVLTHELSGNDLWVVKTGEDPVSVPDRQEAPILQNFTFLQSYPNPFNSTTNLLFTMPSLGDLKIRIYDTIGRQVFTEQLTNLHPGNHHRVWYGIDNNGRNLPTGTYYFELIFKGAKLVRPGVLLD